MKNEKVMKKVIVILAIVAIGIAGFMFIRKRMSVQVLTNTDSKGDLVILNDSADTISAEYKDSTKETSFVLKPGEKVSGGKGFVRIFTAKKGGSYELTYTFPRPAGAAQQVSLSQIIDASQQKKDMGDTVYTEKGMLGDIKVMYEEARVLDSTY